MASSHTFSVAPPCLSPETLALLRISPAELSELCAACTAFIRYIVDQVIGRAECGEETRIGPFTSPSCA